MRQTLTQTQSRMAERHATKRIAAAAERGLFGMEVRHLTAREFYVFFLFFLLLINFCYLFNHRPEFSFAAPAHFDFEQSTSSIISFQTSLLLPRHEKRFQRVSRHESRCVKETRADTLQVSRSQRGVQNESVL